MRSGWLVERERRISRPCPGRPGGGLERGDGRTRVWRRLGSADHTPDGHSLRRTVPAAGCVGDAAALTPLHALRMIVIRRTAARSSFGRLHLRFRKMSRAGRATRHSGREENTMAQFVFLYRRGEEEQPSPEQMQQRMQKWLAWFKELNEKGCIKDKGLPLERIGKVVRGTKKNVTDGPYPEKDL